MYSLNPLMRNVLITTSEVVFHAPTKQDLDPRTIQNAIIIAEERFLRPALGFDLYDHLASTKNVLVAAGNKATLQGKMPTGVQLTEGDIVNAIELMADADQKLWKEYLWKLAAEAVMISAIPDAFVQFASAGVVHGAPTASVMSTAGVVTPELSSVKWVMDKKLQDRIDPLVVAMQLFLCRNKTTYPLYKDCPCDDVEPGTKKTQFILGAYDEE